MKPASAVVPRAVFCVIGDRYRRAEIAREVLRGEFTCAGRTRRLGVPPDWRDAPLPEDEEWRIEWVKFYYGLDLAHAFELSGDRAYLETWCLLVDSFIDADAGAGDATDVVARKIGNWIYAWSRFSAAPAFDGLGEERERRLLETVERDARFVRENLTPERNHRTFELYTLFVVALAFPQIAGARDLLAFARSGLVDNALEDLLDDGVHRENSTHYHAMVLRSFLGALENGRRFGVEFPREYRRCVERAVEFLAHVRRPDGGLPALSDADGGDHADLLALAATLFGRDDLLWCASGGASGRPPSETMRSFPVAGYFVQRSSWGEDPATCRRARHLVFDCGRLGDGGHGHYDQLAVEISGFGEPLLVDPGRYTYDESPPNWRRWFKSTAAHNTVTVDGLDQMPYRRGKPKSAPARARALARLTRPEFDVVAGEVASPCYDAVHRRRIVFVAGRFWIVEDELTGAMPHVYDLRWHFAPAAQGRVTLEHADALDVLTAPGVRLVIAGADRTRLEQGWVSVDYGVKSPAPVSSSVVAGEPSTRFVTVVWPRDGQERARDAGAARIAVEPSGAQAEAEIRITVRDGAHRSAAVVLPAGIAAGDPVRVELEGSW